MDGEAVSQYFDATADVYTTETEIDEMDPPPLVDEFIDHRCKKGDRLLEIGCGDGKLLEYVLEYTDISEAYGIDISTEMLPDPDNDAQGQYLHASATDLPLPFEREGFDFVVMSDVLHHLVGPYRWEAKRRAQAALVEATNLLRPGGYLLVKDIFYESRAGPDTLTSHLIFLGLRHCSGVASRIDVEALPGLLVSFYTRDELRELLRQSGTTVVDRSIERGSKQSTVRRLLVGDSGCIRLYAEKKRRDNPPTNAKRVDAAGSRSEGGADAENGSGARDG
ncbi:class I SAM-dependent methyltransferase [Natronolimnohabitans innermongolicus]|uniref:Methyltransferase type 11 domain-containing protein n=1 Tax=Natronolimnohabitans innermongolicus JCM 12255 TaxID=1227499 RepID=L9WJL2_9EURY|nr:class I SAM-dependent methyltransferase [Natronolimnohabitans innermongolicus]ELY48528.1 hypothetical protein C493_21881 [Natronolimnohabitans innermongolicus JCM 12255]